MKQIILIILVACGLAGCRGAFSAAERATIAAGGGEIMHTYTLRNYDEAKLLRAKAAKISRRALRSDDFAVLRRRMLATVNDKSNPGVGIAAPQVGVSRRMVAVQRYDKPGEPFEFYINPEIRAMGDSVAAGLEGCLSVPVVSGKVMRSREVRLVYRDEHFKRREETVRGFTAVIFQHELDHLDGVLFTDRIIPGTEVYETDEAR